MFLRDYIRPPELKTGGAMGRRKLLNEELTFLYSSAAEAPERFDRIRARPSVLIRFLDRVTWDIVDYPSDDAIPFRIACPFRGHMTPAERERC